MDHKLRGTRCWTTGRIIDDQHLLKGCLDCRDLRGKHIPEGSIVDLLPYGPYKYTADHGCSICIFEPPINLSSLNFSCTREMAPLFIMGSPEQQVSFARGKRGLAGTLDTGSNCYQNIPRQKPLVLHLCMESNLLEFRDLEVFENHLPLTWVARDLICVK